MSIMIKDIGKAVLETEYAVRGPIVNRALELERQGKEIIYCNIGNPQALEQKPLTYTRQVLALCEYPELIETGSSLFPSDVLETAKKLLTGIKSGLGAYSESKGVRCIREAVANFIHDRDGIESDPDSIFLTDGASKGVQSALRILISGPQDGILIPIPQYPLYSATITLLEGKQIPYYLDENNDWKLSLQLLEKAYVDAERMGIKPKAMVVINPGNPTGSVLDENNINMILDFAKKHDCSILADEVYQENIYRKTDKFISFAKMLIKKNEKDVSLFSFHSCSKGYLGECGHRGGYFETRNISGDVVAQILKLQSVGLCANLPGQVAVYCMVKPPALGDPSRKLFEQERDAVLSELQYRAKLVAEGLNKIPGIVCNEVAGSMYAFPKITLPSGKNDKEYCMALLEKTGICVVPGSGFGQVPGTAHFRTTILPPTEKIREVIRLISDFHATYR